MLSPELYCPSCESERIVKNGKTHTGKQNHKCRDCGRQFVEYDELLLFVGNKQWVWLALDRNTRRIVAVHVDALNCQSA